MELSSVIFMLESIKSQISCFLFLSSSRIYGLQLRRNGLKLPVYTIISVFQSLQCTIYVFGFAFTGYVHRFSIDLRPNRVVRQIPQCLHHSTY